MTRLAILAIPLILSGCGIPPAITIASYALDGAIFAASGKTARDHALSAVLDEDCAMFRVINGDSICTEYTPNDAAAAGLETMSASEEVLETTSDGRIIRVAAAPAQQTAPDLDIMVAQAPDAPVLPATQATAPAPASRPIAVVAHATASAALPAAGDPLLTTHDGRVILVAAQPAPEPTLAAGTENPPMLMWNAPDLVSVTVTD